MSRWQLSQKLYIFHQMRMRNALDKAWQFKDSLNPIYFSQPVLL